MKYNQIIWILTIILFGIFIYSLVFSKPKFTIVYNTDGGSEIKNTIITEGNKLLKPTNPTKKGYVFKYWSLNNKEYDFSTEITNNITLTAVWEKESTDEETTTTKKKNTTTSKKTSTKI